MLRILTAALVTVSFALPATAETFKAKNRVEVKPVAGGFEVLGDAGFGARGMWCAAADYARRALKAKGGDQLYVAQPRTPGLGQRGSVVFTIDPAGLTPSSVLILGSSLRTQGARLSVGHAYQFCADGNLIRG